MCGIGHLLSHKKSNFKQCCRHIWRKNTSPFRKHDEDKSVQLVRDFLASNPFLGLSCRNILVTLTFENRTIGWSSDACAICSAELNCLLNVPSSPWSISNACSAVPRWTLCLALGDESSWAPFCSPPRFGMTRQFGIWTFATFWPTFPLKTCKDFSWIILIINFQISFFIQKKLIFFLIRSSRNELESHFLEYIQFNINVSSSVYAKYYFDLRTLADQNYRLLDNLNYNLNFPIEPLSKVRAQELEAMSRSFEDKTLEYHRSRFRRCSSVDRISNQRKSRAILS